MLHRHAARAALAETAQKVGTIFPAENNDRPGRPPAFPPSTIRELGKTKKENKEETMAPNHSRLSNGREICTMCLLGHLEYLFGPRGQWPSSLAACFAAMLRLYLATRKNGVDVRPRPSTVTILGFTDFVMWNYPIAYEDTSTWPTVGNIVRTLVGLCRLTGDQQQLFDTHVWETESLISMIRQNGDVETTTELAPVEDVVHVEAEALSYIAAQTAAEDEGTEATADTTKTSNTGGLKRAR